MKVSFYFEVIFYLLWDSSLLKKYIDDRLCRVAACPMMKYIVNMGDKVKCNLCKKYISAF